MDKCRFHKELCSNNCSPRCELRGVFPPYPGAGVDDSYTLVHRAYGNTRLALYFEGLSDNDKLVRARSLLLISTLWHNNPHGGPLAVFSKMQRSVEKLISGGISDLPQDPHTLYELKHVPCVAPFGDKPTNELGTCVMHSFFIKKTCDNLCPFRVPFPNGSCKVSACTIYKRFSGSVIPSFFKGVVMSNRVLIADSLTWEGKLFLEDKVGGPLAAFEQLARQLSILKHNKRRAQHLIPAPALQLTLSDAVKEEEKVNAVKEEEKVNAVKEEEKVNAVKEEEKVNAVKEEEKVNAVKEEEKVNAVKEEEKVNAVKEEEKVNAVKEEKVNAGGQERQLKLEIPSGHKVNPSVGKEGPPDAVMIDRRSAKEPEQQRQSQRLREQRLYSESSTVDSSLVFVGDTLPERDIPVGTPDAVVIDRRSARNPERQRLSQRLREQRLYSESSTVDSSLVFVGDTLPEKDIPVGTPDAVVIDRRAARNPERQRLSQRLREQRLYSESSTVDSSLVFVGDTLPEKDIPVGPNSQVDIPEHVGLEGYNVDRKWLGTTVWPQPAGEGRKDLCGCKNPSSFECLRKHLRENRMKLEHELGSVYSHWKFNSMGEIVVLDWPKVGVDEREEIVKANPNMKAKVKANPNMKAKVKANPNMKQQSDGDESLNVRFAVSDLEPTVTAAAAVGKVSKSAKVTAAAKKIAK